MATCGSCAHFSRNLDGLEIAWPLGVDSSLYGTCGRPTMACGVVLVLAAESSCCFFRDAVKTKPANERIVLSRSRTAEET